MGNLKEIEKQLRQKENLIATITFMNIIKTVDILSGENLNYIFKLLYINKCTYNEITKKCFISHKTLYNIRKKFLTYYNNLQKHLKNF